MRTFGMTTRRQVLRVLLGLGAVCLVRRADLLTVDQGEGVDQLLSEKLTSLFHHKTSAAMIGLEYLRSRPNEADARQLTRLICSRWPGQLDERTFADARNIQKILLRQVREDFDKDRIVHVRGWILSETEARLSALAALV
jgi:hypothetical protein